jgi:hypothetical protein
MRVMTLRSMIVLELFHEVPPSVRLSAKTSFKFVSGHDPLSGTLPAIPFSSSLGSSLRLERRGTVAASLP